MFGKNWSKAKARYDAGKMDIQTFVNTMKDAKVYYSTPVGNDSAGREQLYLLSSHHSEAQFFPAFLSMEHCMQFLTDLGRVDFMVIEGDLRSFLSSLDILTPLVPKLGAVIEPNSTDEMAVPPGIRVQ